MNAERHSVLSDIAVMMEDNEEKEIDNNSFSDEIQIVVPTPQVPEQSERGSVTTRKAQYKTSMSFRRDLMHDYPNQENSLYKEFSSQSSPTQKALKPLPRAKKTWDHISMDAVAEFGSTVSTSEQKQRQKESLPLLSIFKTDRGKRKDASEELFGSLIKGISYSTTRSAQTMDVTQRILLPRSVRYFPAPLPESDHDEQQAIVESTA